MNDEDLSRLLRAAIPPVPEAAPRQDLWPAMEHRLTGARRVNLLDLAVAAAVAYALLAVPGAFWLLAYHL
jgi:hypothetical protein